MAHQPLTDIRQTLAYSRYMQSMGWQDEMIKTLHGQIHCYKKYLPFIPFPIIKILRAPAFLNFFERQTIINRYHPIIFKQEPFHFEKNNCGQVYFSKEKSNTSPLVPTKTLWINLGMTKQTLLNNCHAKTRYNLKKAQQRVLQTQIISGDKITENNLKSFYKLWSVNKPHNWLFKPSFYELKNLVSSFGKDCFFVFIFSPCHPEFGSGSCPLLAAACLILTSPNMAFYWHNASTLEGKKIFAPTLCVWEAIMESKKRGLNVFDFEGIWDERFPKLNVGWQGFTRFKKGFVENLEKSTS
mgnify:CR=1 FL=1